MNQLTMAADTPVERPDTNRVFRVLAYHVEGNTVLPPREFDVLTNYTGTNITLVRLREGLGQLELLYRDLGFPTVAVTLPEQKVTNGIVRVRVVEGRLSRIEVTHNNWFSVANVLRAVPGLTTNVILNTRWLQPELDRANANSDRQIYPEVGPGPDPGTTELTLRVEDRFPLHGHIEINDKSTPQTPLLRLDSSVEYDNLWQHEQQVGFDYNFSPQDFKPAGTPYPVFYDAPMVASYSTFYRIPIQTTGNLRASYEESPGTFGFDQVTHQFNLPPPVGTPEFIFFASRSTTDTGDADGPRSLINHSATLDVEQETVARNPNATEDAGGKFTLPLPDAAGIKSSVSVGVDYKYYQSSSASIHYTYIQEYSTNASAPPTLVESGVVTNSQSKDNSVYYLPLSAGWSGSRSDRWGSLNFFYNENIFLPLFQSPRADFQKLGGEGGTYTSLTAGLIRQQQLPRGWSALVNASGQWASEPLIGNEQFALGGTAGVRGYREGETYGDSGYRTQFDLRAPAVNVGYFPLENQDIPAELRCSWFMDYGEAFHANSTASVQQWGTGLGFYLTAGEHFDARLTLGWALLSTVDTSAGSAQAYFTVGFQF